ncbi:hypothetical protein [Nitrosomonas sp.]|uniref:hypothetical protein n=1 Tax=Nitrosomonas sp. TaxID=42353 RepID=UPI002722E3E2|nr:hypothetical protein [Nitrosomonas sp.]MDO8893782.1 hypothetical protein [Nitrosomonas sp.]
MPKVGEISDDEYQDYHEIHRLTVECILDSISKLKKRNRAPNITPGEVAENDAKILELEANIEILKKKLAAFEENKVSITPPTDPQLDSLKELIAKVDKLNTNQKIFVEAVKLSTDALTEFNKIHPN